MKKYISPEVEVIDLHTADVITMSVGELDNGTNYNITGVDMSDYFA